MLLTEKEAAEKWCPHARVANNATAPNRSADQRHVREQAMCIGSRCTQWRWRMIDDPKRSGPGDRMLRLVPTDRGYCGIAGKPDEARIDERMHGQ